MSGVWYRGTSLIRNSLPPWDHHRATCVVLLQGPRGALFLMREVPLYGTEHLLRLLYHLSPPFAAISSAEIAILARCAASS